MQKIYYKLREGDRERDRQRQEKNVAAQTPSGQKSILRFRANLYSEQLLLSKASQATEDLPLTHRLHKHSATQDSKYYINS